MKDADGRRGFAAYWRYHPQRASGESGGREKFDFLLDKRFGCRWRRLSFPKTFAELPINVLERGGMRHRAIRGAGVVKTWISAERPGSGMGYSWYQDHAGSRVLVCRRPQLIRHNWPRPHQNQNSVCAAAET